MLVAYSTTGQHVSIDTESGSIWINCLLEELKNNPHEDTLSKLDRVNKTMTKDTIPNDGYYQIGEYRRESIL